MIFQAMKNRKQGKRKETLSRGELPYLEVMGDPHCERGLNSALYKVGGASCDDLRREYSRQREQAWCL